MPNKKSVTLHRDRPIFYRDLHKFSQSCGCPSVFTKNVWNNSFFIETSDSSIYLYYKDKKQLKIFLTKIEFTVLLTLDPHIRAERDRRGWKPIEIESWRAFLPQTKYFFTHHSHTRLGPHGYRTSPPPPAGKATQLPLSLALRSVSIDWENYYFVRRPRGWDRGWDCA